MTGKTSRTIFIGLFLLLIVVSAFFINRISAQNLVVGLPGVHSDQLGLIDEFTKKFIEAAVERTTHKVRYDGRYVKLAYPGGDVPDDTGVCTDVIIRVYRVMGIDLQKEVHTDMRRNFALYPKIWGLKRPDTNIDHRRVPNLQTFFTRKGQKLKVSETADNYLPGNLVTWMLPGNLPHIGIVTDRRSEDGQRPLIVHNIGAGPVLEDMLFTYKITGHYCYPAKPARRIHND